MSLKFIWNGDENVQFLIYCINVNIYTELKYKIKIMKNNLL